MEKIIQIVPTQDKTVLLFLTSEGRILGYKETDKKSGWYEAIGLPFRKDGMFDVLDTNGEVPDIIT